MSKETATWWTLNNCMIAWPYKNFIWIWIDFYLCDLPRCVLDCHFMKHLCDSSLAYGTLHSKAIIEAAKKKKQNKNYKEKKEKNPSVLHSSKHLTSLEEFKCFLSFVQPMTPQSSQEWMFVVNYLATIFVEYRTWDLLSSAVFSLIHVTSFVIWL